NSFLQNFKTGVLLPVGHTGPHHFCTFAATNSEAWAWSRKSRKEEHLGLSATLTPVRRRSRRNCCCSEVPYRRPARSSRAKSATTHGPTGWRSRSSAESP